MSYFMTSHEITQNTDILITAGSFHKYHVESPKYRSGNSSPPKKIPNITNIFLNISKNHLNLFNYCLKTDFESLRPKV